MYKKESPAALVTGANKGLGYEVVRQISPKFQGTVYLTARNVDLGQTAEQTLQKEGFVNVKFLQMDVTDKTTIDKARDFIKQNHGGLDILVNNAGVYVGQADLTKGASADQSPDAIKQVIATNFTGLLDVCQAFFPILRPHARVVNVSSNLCTLRFLKNADLKKQLISKDLTVEGLVKIMSDYVQAGEQGKAVELGYPNQHGSYAMSKVGVTALSRVQQRDFDADRKRPDIVVNSCCPGYVATDINGNSGTKTVQEGADTLSYLALLPPQATTGAHAELVKPRGEFVYERRVYDWAAEEVPADLVHFLV